MAQKKVGAGADKDPPAERTFDEEKLARSLAAEAWTAEQAKQVLAAQGHSRQTIAQFAKKHGLTPERLYNWKRKLGPGPWLEPRSGEREGEPQQGASVQEVELDLLDPGERFMYDYVQRATQGPEPMWRLLAIRRQGAVLWCVVRWVQHRVEAGSYSLVQLELTEPALRWNDFATAEAATQALQRRCSSAVAPPGEASVPMLLPVQVRGQGTSPPAGAQEPQPPKSFVPCMTICLPSGVRIQIGEGVPPSLMRTMLRVLGAPSC